MTALSTKLDQQSLTRLWRLKPSTKLCNDFYVLDVETAYRRKAKLFTLSDPSSFFSGTLNWRLDATPDSFIFGVLYGYNYCKVIHSVEEFKQTLLEPRFKNRVIFAHNGGAYDYPCIYGNPYDTDPEAIFNGKFISFTNGNCTFADSLNIFVGLSIKAIGEMTGNKKLGMSRNYTKSVWPKDYARDVNGCIRDCQILYDALFLTFEFAGDIKITQASLSMCYYRRYHQPYNIDHNENTKHFWSSYYGGRTECFYIGKCHASILDVNSMYPFHSRNGTFPNPKTLKVEVNFEPRKLKKYLGWYEGMIDATIEHLESDIGFLPVKTKKPEEKLLFPIGKFRGCWNFPEIRFALKHKKIKILKIHKICYGDKMESPFVSYMDTLHDMKLEAQRTDNKWQESMSKYFMNMLYGKFGQRIDEESIYIKDIEKQFHIIEGYQRKKLFIKLTRFSKDRDDAMLVISKRGNRKPPYSIPSFASYITAYGRVQVLEKMIEMKPNKVLYCDTDGIAFTINNGIVSSNKFGEWKIEKKIITELKGLKNYTFIEPEKGPDEIYRSKGVPLVGWIKDEKGGYKRNRKKVSIFDNKTGKVTIHDSVSQTGNSSFEYWNILKPKEALKRGLEPGVLTKRTKVLSGRYDKREVFKDGNTKPILLYEN